MKEHEFKELLKESESTWLDWKKDFPPGLVKGSGDPEWEKGKGSLLKDLVSIANCDEEKIGFLVYGVKDNGTKRNVTGITKSWDDATFQEWVINTFKPPLQFSYSELELSTKRKVGIFSIEPSSEYPHVTYRRIGEVIYEGQVWFRRGSRNCLALYEDLKDMFTSPAPIKVGKADGSTATTIIEYYKSRGDKAGWVSLYNKDDKIEGGYKIAYKPKTRREVWLKEECILMLQPK